LVFFFVYSLVFTARNGGLVIGNANKTFLPFLFIKKNREEKKSCIVGYFLNNDRGSLNAGSFSQFRQLPSQTSSSP
jgi:hypothetical protein